MITYLICITASTNHSVLYRKGFRKGNVVGEGCSRAYTTDLYNSKFFKRNILLYRELNKFKNVSKILKSIFMHFVVDGDDTTKMKT